MKATIKLSPAEVTEIIRAYIFRAEGIQNVMGVNPIITQYHDDKPLFEGIEVLVNLKDKLPS